jgi:hypothetical protein
MVDESFNGELLSFDLRDEKCLDMELVRLLATESETEPVFSTFGKCD